MTSLDLQTWLSLISTIAIVLALVFAGVQVREANQARQPAHQKHRGWK